MSAKYEVTCPSCGRVIDAMTAEFCSCVAKESTIACPHCGQCLCGIEGARRRDFWLAAPAALRERWAGEQKRRKATLEPKQEAFDVLVVDDDEEIRSIAALMVQEMGYRVALAATPDEALRLVSALPPRVVVTDALMPRMDGRELCRAIKQRNPQIKVVIMTSLYTARRYKTEAYKVFGADAYLAKPIGVEEFKSTIDKLMAEVA